VEEGRLSSVSRRKGKGLICILGHGEIMKREGNAGGGRAHHVASRVVVEALAGD
jgi:hypothetical protein